MTRTISNVIRTLGVAALLAAALSAPAGAVHAEGKSLAQTLAQLNCEGRGYDWVDGKGCADKACPGGGDPGELDIELLSNGQTSIWICDGLTGRWDPVDIQPNPPTRGPRFPVAPRPGGGVLSLR